MLLIPGVLESKCPVVFALRHNQDLRLHRYAVRADCHESIVGAQHARDL